MGNIIGRNDSSKIWEKDMNLRSCRKASHAGILYNDRGNALSQQLDNWLSKSDVPHGPARAIIVPHSRYSESGACAAAAYRQVRPDLIKYVVILAPAHHFKFKKLCSLTQFEKCQTPLYDLPVDLEFNAGLYGAFHFGYSNKNDDENEYSIEIQFPFIAKIMEKFLYDNIVDVFRVMRQEQVTLYIQQWRRVNISKREAGAKEKSLPKRIISCISMKTQHMLFAFNSKLISFRKRRYKNQFKIIPILVGDLTQSEENKYGHIFAPCIIDPRYLFVISTDFCHWGEKYNYTWSDPSKGVKESVEWLDKQGMKIIEKMDASDFSEYLYKYGNNICGSNAINILLNALKNSGSDLKMSIKFLNYSQSCTKNEKNEIDSIKSFASASLVIEDRTWRGYFKNIIYNINLWN